MPGEPHCYDRVANWGPYVLGAGAAGSSQPGWIEARLVESDGSSGLGTLPGSSGLQPVGIGHQIAAVTRSGARAGVAVYRLDADSLDSGGWAGPTVVDGSVWCSSVAVTSVSVVCASGYTRVYDLAALPAPLRTPRPVAPADGEIIHASATLTWRSSPGARSYTLEYARTPDLLGASAALARVESLTDTTYSVGPVPDRTTMYWRVWAETEGNGSAWSPIRSFTTFTTPPAAAPALVVPADGAVLDTPVELRWNPVADAERYRLQVSLSEAFETTVIDNFTTALAANTPPLPRGQRYYWRVHATNGVGAGPWSAVRLFDVRLQLPAVPLLGSPTNGSTGTDRQPRLTWQRTSGASSYDVQIALDHSFALLVAEANLVVHEYIVQEPLQPTQVHFWRVRGVNSDGAGPWSAVWHFTTNATVSTSDDGLPREFALSEARPNPARAAVTLDLALPAAARVRLSAYDVLGREVAVVRAGDALPAGRHVVVWDATVPSGVYVLRAEVWPSGEAPARTFTRRVAVAR